MESFFRHLNLLELDGYCFERFLIGGEAASLAIFKRGIGHVLLKEPVPERVAVKFLIAPRRERELETFRREAETLLRIHRYGQSPTIVKALCNVRSLDGLPVHYFFMDYVDGVSLKELFAKDPLPWEAGKALDLLKRITAALIPAAANAEVHRDLHPGNIMIAGPVTELTHLLIADDPGIRILDFGVGRNWVTDQRDDWQEDRFRHPGAVSSWSPELLSDPSVVDSKHDVWALGNLFYRMVTGEFAFYADHFKGYFDRVQSGAYDVELLEGQPFHVKRLIASMFELSPRKRISLGGLLKITTDICDSGLVAWLEHHPALAELYFLVEGNIWTCPLCSATNNPTNDGRCRACGRYAENFLPPF